jgi:DNA-binding transcriptional LysR family regulator
LLHSSNRPGQNQWKLTDPSGATFRIPANGGFSVNDRQSLLQAATAGLGIAYQPRFLCDDAMSTGSVVDVMPSLPPNTQNEYAVFCPGRYTQPKVRAFIDFLVAALAGDPQTKPPIP